MRDVASLTSLALVQFFLKHFSGCENLSEGCAHPCDE